jgi:predicted aconitase/predicted aconitase with swiveling domain
LEAQILTMTSIHSGRVLVRGNSPTRASQILLTATSLSFWGGIEPETGKIVDASHPLFGQNVSDKILCLPSGRGSCTASQVLLELILKKKAPKAIVLRDLDGLVCVGALVAQEIFDSDNVPDILCLGSESYNRLLEQSPEYGRVTEDGDFIISNDMPTIESAANASLREEESFQLALTEQEQEMVEEASNEAERMALRVLIRYAKVISSSPEDTSYIDVAKAHIDGCTYIGPGGLEFVQKLRDAGGRVKIPTTLNSVSADRSQWQALGVPKDRALASIEVGNAYLGLGCDSSFTCAPYLLKDPPQLGQDIVWGESNAVVYANSVLGARTEKYADYLDICCALVGKVPADGVHLSEKRKPRIVLDARDLLNDLWLHSSASRKDLELLFPVLGHLCGTLSDGEVPILLGFHEQWSEFVTSDHLKSFCAAFGTTGTSPLIHIAGITPEANEESAVNTLVDVCDRATRVVTMLDLQETFDALDSSTADNAEKIDLVALGNPHLSLTECEALNKLVEKEEKHASTRVMACISRALFSRAKTLGYVSKLEEFGIEFVNDTCWCMLLDGPVIPTNPTAVIMTNSGKYAHYGPGLTNREFRFGTMAECVTAAATGRYPRQQQSLKRFMDSVTTGCNNQRRRYSTCRRQDAYSCGILNWQCCYGRQIPATKNIRPVFALLRLAIG